PAASGSVVATGSVNGDTQNPVIDAELQGEAIAWDTLPMPALERLTVRIAGRLEQHDLELAATSELGRATLMVSQGFADDRLRGTLRDSMLAPRDAGIWALTEPARYAVDLNANAELSLTASCYAGPDAARLCLSIADEHLA